MADDKQSDGGEEQLGFDVLLQDFGERKVGVLEKMGGFETLTHVMEHL